MSTRQLLKDIDEVVRSGKLLCLNRGGNIVVENGTWKDDDSIERYQFMWLSNYLPNVTVQYGLELGTVLYHACRARPSCPDTRTLQRSRWLRKIIRRRYRLVCRDKVHVGVCV